MRHKKNVRIFRQNETMETCLCCCILMVLDYYYLLPGGTHYPTRKMEDSFYRYLGYQIPDPGEIFDRRFTRGTPLSAAAYVFSENGLDVTLYHSEEGYLNNTRGGTPYYPENIFPTVLDKYTSWLKKAGSKLRLAVCEEASREFLTGCLDEQKLIVAACIVDSEEGDTLHCILIDGYQEEKGRLMFHLCNPASGKHLLDSEELIRRMDTPVGIHFMTVGAG